MAHRFAPPNPNHKNPTILEKTPKPTEPEKTMRLNCVAPAFALFVLAMVLFAFAYFYVSSQSGPPQHRDGPPTADGYYD